MIIIAALVLSGVVLALFFAIVVGLRLAHPTDLAIQRQSCLARLASRTVGLHVRRPEPPREAPADDRDWAVR